MPEISSLVALAAAQRAYIQTAIFLTADMLEMQIQ